MRGEKGSRHRRNYSFLSITLIKLVRNHSIHTFIFTKSLLNSINLLGFNVRPRKSPHINLKLILSDKEVIKGQFSAFSMRMSSKSRISYGKFADVFIADDRPSAIESFVDIDPSSSVFTPFFRHFGDLLTISTQHCETVELVAQDGGIPRGIQHLI